MRVIYHPAAEADLIQSVRFYEQRVLGLGKEFVEAVDRAIAVIVEDPQCWRIVRADVRRYVMPRFPFAIYYRLLEDHLRILTIKHHKRHPNYGQDRR